MDLSEEDQRVAVSAASAMSLKRSISSLDLAADARAARARHSAQPSNKEGLEDPTLETPLKDTGLPPSPPAPPIDGRTLSDLEVLRTIETIKYDLGMDTLGMDTLAQLLADKTTTDKTTTDKGFNDLGPVALPRIGKKERFSKPCPRQRQAGHRAGQLQFCSKPFNCGCCMGTCQLCEFAKAKEPRTTEFLPEITPTDDADICPPPPSRASKQYKFGEQFLK